MSRFIPTELFLWFIPLGLFINCAGLKPIPTSHGHDTELFRIKDETPLPTFTSSATIQALASDGPDDYQFGPGDVLDVSVWNRPEISRSNIVVAPDGTVSIPRIGVINVKERSIRQVTEMLRDELAINYVEPEVTVLVKEFKNNKAFVLGRVTKPGVVNFPGKGTLLEALALAGGLPFIGKETFLTRCAIIRGNSQVFWIDLTDLLDRGNMALNARILNNDVIFIPEAEDEMVLVMGEVLNPGPIQLKRGLSLLDAITRAGGATNTANLNNVFIIRQKNREDAGIVQVSLKEILERGHLSTNFQLQKDDVVYVSPSGIQKFNYALEQLMPSLRVLSIGSGIMNNLGLSNKTVTLQEKDNQQEQSNGP